MLGLILMTTCLILLYILYLRLLPLYGIILGLISQSLCLTLKFGGYSIISTIANNLSLTPSVLACDITTLVIEIAVMSVLLAIIKSRNYLVFEICKILPSHIDKGNEVKYEEKWPYKAFDINAFFACTYYPFAHLFDILYKHRIHKTSKDTSVAKNACYIFFYSACNFKFVHCKNLFSALSILKATQVYKDNIKSLDNFINILRAQRHEFNNHLQIIWGLICVGKYDDAIRYIEQISENLKNTSKFYGLGCAELSALIFAKSALAEKYEYKF